MQLKLKQLIRKQICTYFDTQIRHLWIHGPLSPSGIDKAKSSDWYKDYQVMRSRARK